MNKCFENSLTALMSMVPHNSLSADSMRNVHKDKRSQYWRLLELCLKTTDPLSHGLDHLVFYIDESRSSDCYGNTVLHYIVSDCSYRASLVAEFLIKKAVCDKNAKNNYGFSPLKYALLHCNYLFADYLISSDANHVEIVVNDSLELLTYNQHIYCDTRKSIIYSKMSLMKKRELGFSDDCHWSALHLAVASNSNDSNRSSFLLIERLVKKGADVNKTTKRGYTALHYASAFGNDSVAHLLLTAGANINALNDFQATPLFCATVNGLLTTVEWLIKAGANVNITNSNGSSCLYMAVLHGRYDIVKVLLENGAIISTPDNQNPLHAALFRHGCVRELLLDCAPGSYDHLFEKDEKCIELLLEFGARLDQSSEIEGLPIFCAIMKNCHKRVVRILLRDGHPDDVGLKTGLMYLFQYAKDDKHNAIEVIRHVAGIEAQNGENLRKLELKNLPKKQLDEYRRCLNELQLMECYKIQGCKLTYLNIFVSKNIVTYVKNPNVVEALKGILNFFPIYGRILQNRFKKALTRLDLMRAASKGLDKFAYPINESSYYPVHASIFNNLTCHELKNLADV